MFLNSIILSIFTICNSFVKEDFVTRAEATAYLDTLVHTRKAYFFPLYILEQKVDALSISNAVH